MSIVIIWILVTLDAPPWVWVVFIISAFCKIIKECVE